MRGAFAHAAVCADRSDRALSALAEARRLRPERLSVVHVGGGAEARRWLDALAAEAPGAEAVLLSGPTSERLIGWARAERPDLLVAASHGGLVAGVLGSTARRLASSAPCPTLVLPPGVGPGDEPAPGAAPYANIACCIDDSPASMRALEQARRLRALGPGSLSLVHVAPRALIEEPPPGAPPGAPRDVAFDERDWLMATAAGVPGAEAVPLEGGPEAAVAWARAARPDLMVAGARERGPVERALLGSFAAHLAREAPCPALLTR
ncbi:MAG TPA: universal stress protein [Miltoncostaeaceae bacterium]|nr:universal stress protein [Miltoncostaeaceae bacterium]